MRLLNNLIRFICSFVLIVLVIFVCSCIEIHKEYSINILYTNDIHTNIQKDNGLSYAKLLALKQSLGPNTLVVDAGDHVHGTIYGLFDKGGQIQNITNLIYDASAIGNHEFDYGMERLNELVNSSTYPYLCCNFVYKDTNTSVFTPYTMINIDSIKIAFIGITTPELMTTTNPATFLSNDEVLYDVIQGEDLYNTLNYYTKLLKSEGADYIIGLSHVGLDNSLKQNSVDIINNTSYFDAIIDGHSHTEMECEYVLDKDHKEVLLTQTGEYFNKVGLLTITNNSISSKLISSFDKENSDIEALTSKLINDVDILYSNNIATLDKTLSIYDIEGIRVVRRDETLIGNLIADSFYYYANFIENIDCDIATINGGGIRSDLQSGYITYKDIKSVLPFDNLLCVVKVTGKEVLELLEYATMYSNDTNLSAELGGFPSVSGIKFSVDTSILSTIQLDEGGYAGSPTSSYRVFDVLIYDKTEGVYLPLDENKEYTIIGTDFSLVYGGDGYKMLKPKIVRNYLSELYMALANYLMSFNDSDDDGYPNISSSNSPLYNLDNFIINYEEDVNYRINYINSK